MAELGFQERSSWRKREKKAKVQDDEDRDADIQEPVELDSARNSFSLALKDKRSKFEALLKKAASLDLNNDFGSGSSRRLQTLKKSSISSRRSGTATFPIPGTPNFHIAMYKGWSSEQVPLYAGATQKHVFPFNNGKTLPSKWEDAERWIISPVSADTESVIINAPPRTRGEEPKISAWENLQKAKAEAAIRKLELI
ncbi:hypothetical protein GLYMA_03G083500v4 [Glycine max]|nr:hypothetical protein GLYMA_03G083500v4 [Glycine max]KAH1069105.1 hypothetical protein GYH30_006618 [Glycine max]